MQLGTSINNDINTGYAEHDGKHALLAEVLHRWLFRPREPAGLRFLRRNWSWITETEGLSDYDVWLCIKGKGTMKVNSQVYNLRRGSALLFRPGDHLEGVHDPNDPLTIYAAHFEICDCATNNPIIADDCLTPRRFRLLDPVEPFEKLMEHYANVTDHHDELSKVEAPALLKIIWTWLWRLDLTMPRIAPDYLHHKLAPVLDRVKAYPEKRFKLGEMAELLGMNPDHLSRLCRRVTGYSFQAYCIRVRLARACWLLQHSPMTIEEVAMELGYPDIYSFSHQFKRVYGVAPSFFRRNQL